MGGKMKRLERLSLSAVLLAAVLVFILSSSAVLAEDYCTIDDYGCWVPGDDGGKMYIMFWSEASRQFFMGDTTAPYQNVVDYCADCGGRLRLDPAPTPVPAKDKKGLVIKIKTGKQDIEEKYPDGMAMLKGIVAFADYSDIADGTAIGSVYSVQMNALEISGTMTFIPILETDNFDKLESIYSGLTVVDAYAACNAGQFVHVKLVEGVLSGLAFTYTEFDPPHYFLLTPSGSGQLGNFSPTPVYAELTDGGVDEYGVEYVMGVWDESKTEEIFTPIY